MVRLARHLGAGCREVTNPTCGVEILDALAERFRAVRRADPNGRFDWPAQQALKLISLQREESAKWGRRFLAGMAELADEGRPVETAARVVIAGATGHMTEVLSRTPWKKRLTLFLRTLGFDCPAASNPARTGGRREVEPGCRLACPELKQRLIQSPPELRKRLIAAHCPLRHLGFTSRGQSVYLSQDGLRAARNLVYLHRNLAELLEQRDHPLIRLLGEPLRGAKRRLEKLRLGLPYPEMSPGEQGYVKLPFSPVATEDTYAPVYVAADVHRTSVGIMPILSVEGGRTIIVGEREGYPFPGRLVPEPLEDELPGALDRVKKVWAKVSGVPSWRPLGFYAHSELPAKRFNRIAGVLVRQGVSRLRLLLRSDRAGVGGLTVTLSIGQGGSGRWGRPPEGSVVLFLDQDEMVLTASEGPLAKEPFRSRSSDLAGLREHLERSRSAYRENDTILLRFRGDVRYLEMSRVLVSVLRNSSGRTLYPRVEIRVGAEPT
jgi:hypothetical protein